MDPDRFFSGLLHLQRVARLPAPCVGRSGGQVLSYLNVEVIEKNRSYFTVAISELLVHATIMFISDGVFIMNQKYVHAIPQVEPEPEEDVIPDGE